MTTRRVSPTRYAGAAACAAAVALTSLAVLVAPDGASAAQPCAVIVIKNSGLGFMVTSGSVAKGRCVQFANQTGETATVSVSGTAYTNQKVAAHATSPATTQPTAKPGKYDINVSEDIRMASGTLEVTKPAPSPSPSSSASASASAKPSSSASASSSSVPTTGPDVAPSPKAGKGKKHKRPATPKIVLPPLPALPSAGASSLPLGSDPLVAPGMQPSTGLSVEPTADPSTSPVVVSSAIRPVHGPGKGLPAAVAAMVVVGIGGAWVRGVKATDRS